MNIRIKQKEGGEQVNVRLPVNQLKDIFFDNDTRCLTHLQKIDPSKPFGDIDFEIDVKEDAASTINTSANRANAPPINVINIGGMSSSSSTAYNCWSCSH